jgi:Ca2+:H+ antiporter
MTHATARLAIAWTTVAAFLLAGKVFLTDVSPVGAVAVFAWLFGVIIWSAFGVVHEAEELAERL